MLDLFHRSYGFVFDMLRVWFDRALDNIICSNVVGGCVSLIFATMWPSIGHMFGFRD